MPEVIGKRHHVHLPRYGWDLKQGLDFRCECEPLMIGVIVERFYSETIARAEQYLAIFIPNGEREHATKPVDASFPVFLPRVQKCFCVGTCAKAMSGRD